MQNKEVLEYISAISERYKRGDATEHTYRPDLQRLIELLVKDVVVTNEPKRIACGAPDYIITKKDIPVGYIEAKDLGQELNNKLYKEQFERYKASLSNLIITNYIDFHYYKEGVLVTSIKIAKINVIPDNTGRALFKDEIAPISENIEQFVNFIKDFTQTPTPTITGAEKLARMMAGKARMLSEVIEKALVADEKDNLNPNTALQSQLHAFKDILIHDITPKDFADIYAQTIAYGMFAARLHDPTLSTFSRQEAAELIPKTNPFLRKLFQYIAGYDLDTRIVWIVDGLADLFRHTDIAKILKNFGKSTRTHDPIIHFYETFLSEYDPKLRKARGVWYTPEPVVNFIVRAVDEVLKTEFDLKDGLANTTKTKIRVKIPTHDKRYKAGQIDYEQEVHKVQILDPATGTGTFLAEVVRQVYQKFEGQEGIWSDYVEKHLVPRLNGFEILMASYAMAHLKLDMVLSETGYKPSEAEQRFKIYLTNSLEEHHPETGTLFANWLSTEANEANHIKRDTPVMVILGNPPYAVSSTNKSDWIENLTADYKKDMKEKNIQPLSDDYIKFIRFGQHFIDKNGAGVLAYISNNSFLEGIIHRQMRKHLLESFDKIYILDLHGNAKKKEVSNDGKTDQNVFDIMQGVSINIFIKTGKKKKNELAQVFQCDLYGKRDYKYETLSINSLKSIVWNSLKYKEPNFFFTNKNFIGEKKYEKGFKIDTLFLHSNSGLATEFDDLSIKDSMKEAVTLLKDLKECTASEIISKYNLDPKKIKKVENAIKDIKTNTSILTEIDYRPFDFKYTIYTGVSNGLMGRPRDGIMKHMLKDNLALLTCRQQTSFDFQHVFISNKISERCSVSLQTGEVNYIFPIYLYPETDTKKKLIETNERIPNLDVSIIKKICDTLKIEFTAEKVKTTNTFAPIDILDYIYAILHCPSYRDKYKEFLKIDFPRVPYPSEVQNFWQLVKLGSELRQVHLLESETISKYITTYPIVGNNEVIKPIYLDNRVYINDTQYFDKVPQVAWEFYIGGYQPAQKWLKDRRGRILEYEDIQHYQKIIVALKETVRLMNEIDKIVDL